MRANNIVRQKFQAGVSLVEVLVTVLITGVGVMGMAAMQSTSIKMSYDSMLRTQATLLYYDLADRMRANPDVDYELLISTSTVPLPAPTCNGNAATCTPEEIMAHDRYYWWLAANSVLPNPRLAIQPPVAPSNLTTITIRWGSQVDSEEADFGNINTFQTLEFQVEI